MFARLPDPAGALASVSEAKASVASQLSDTHPGSQDSGKSALENKFDVDDLAAKLDSAEKKIKGMLAAAVPKVCIQLPMLRPEVFGGAKKAPDGAGEYGLVEFEREALEAPQKTLAGCSTTKVRAAEVQAKAEQAQRKAQEAAAEMEEDVRRMLELQRDKFRAQVMVPVSAAIASLVVALSLAYAQVGALMGPLLAACIGTVMNSSALFVTWKARADFIFGVLNSQVSKAKDKVADVLDTVDDMIEAPLNRLEEAIDDMAEEQKPAMDAVALVEKTMHINLPDPQDLKVPLSGCDELLDDFVSKAKLEIPRKMDEMLCSYTAGKVATSSSLWNVYVVLLPLALVFFVNASIAVTQTMVFSPSASPAANVPAGASLNTILATQEDTNATKVVARMLRGEMAREAESQPAGVSSLEEELAPYIAPVLVQIVITVMQMVAALSLSKGPRVCALANSALERLQMRINDRINDRIKSAVDKVFVDACGEVKVKADAFFPAFRESLGGLKKAMEAYAKAQAAAKAARGAFGAAQGLLGR